MEDNLNKLAKQLTEDKTVNNIETFNSLTNIDKYCLNKFCNMNFEIVETYSDDCLWFKASEKGYVKVVKYLIYKGIDVNLNFNLGTTALMLASFYGYVEVVKLLLQHPSIDVNLQNEYGSSALIIASRDGKVDVVELLLQQPNIDVSLENFIGKTASNLAKNKEIKFIIKNFQKNSSQYKKMY